MSKPKLHKLMLVGEDAEQKKLIESSFSSAYDFREKAVKHLMGKLNRISKDQRSKEGYKLPAYAEFQADCNATVRTIEEVLLEIFNVGGKNVRLIRRSENSNKDS